MDGPDLDEEEHREGFNGMVWGIVIGSFILLLVMDFSTISFIMSIFLILLAWVMYNSERAYDVYPQIEALLLPSLHESEEKSSEAIENDELRQQVEDRKAEGWEVDEITNDSKKVIMKTTQGGTIGGHALTGLTTGLWTLGAGNVAYNKLSKKKNSERIVLRAKEDIPDNASEPKQITDVSTKLRELKDLNEDGIITDEEFEEKKEELLGEY